MSQGGCRDEGPWAALLLAEEEVQEQDLVLALDCSGALSSGGTGELGSPQPHLSASQESVWSAGTVQGAFPACLKASKHCYEGWVAVTPEAPGLSFHKLLNLLILLLKEKNPISDPSQYTLCLSHPCERHLGR